MQFTIFKYKIHSFFLNLILGITIAHSLEVFDFAGIPLKKNYLENFGQKIPTAMGNQGTVIGYHWVLTAASIGTPKIVTIRGKGYSVQQSIPCPLYNSTTGDFDLQLLQTKEQITNAIPILPAFYYSDDLVQYIVEGMIVKSNPLTLIVGNLSNPQINNTAQGGSASAIGLTHTLKKRIFEISFDNPKNAGLLAVSSQQEANQTKELNKELFQKDNPKYSALFSSYGTYFNQAPGIGRPTPTDIGSGVFLLLGQGKNPQETDFVQIGVVSGQKIINLLHKDIKNWILDNIASIGDSSSPFRTPMTSYLINEFAITLEKNAFSPTTEYQDLRFSFANDLIANSFQNEKTNTLRIVQKKMKEEYQDSVSALLPQNQIFLYTNTTVDNNSSLVTSQSNATGNTSTSAYNFTNALSFESISNTQVPYVVLKVPTFQACNPQAIMDLGYCPIYLQRLLDQVTKTKAEYIVIDLRNNQSGSIDNALDFIENFTLSRETLFLELNKEQFQRLTSVFPALITDRKLFSETHTKYLAQKANQEYPLNLPSELSQHKNRFIVLVNQKTSGAAELVALALKNYLNAPIIGSKTAGYTPIVESKLLYYGFKAQYPIGEYFARDGQRIHGIGIKPDFEAASEQEFTQKALSWMGQMEQKKKTSPARNPLPTPASASHKASIATSSIPPLPKLNELKINPTSVKDVPGGDSWAAIDSSWVLMTQKLSEITSQTEKRTVSSTLECPFVSGPNNSKIYLGYLSAPFLNVPLAKRSAQAFLQTAECFINDGGTQTKSSAAREMIPFYQKNLDKSSYILTGFIMPVPSQTNSYRGVLLNDPRAYLWITNQIIQNALEPNSLAKQSLSQTNNNQLNGNKRNIPLPLIPSLQTSTKPQSPSDFGWALIDSSWVFSTVPKPTVSLLGFSFEYDNTLEIKVNSRYSLYLSRLQKPFLLFDPLKRISNLPPSQTFYYLTSSQTLKLLNSQAAELSIPQGAANHGNLGSPLFTPIFGNELNSLSSFRLSGFRSNAGEEIKLTSPSTVNTQILNHMIRTALE